MTCSKNSWFISIALLSRISLADNSNPTATPYKHTNAGTQLRATTATDTSEQT